MTTMQNWLTSLRKNFGLIILMGISTLIILYRAMPILSLPNRDSGVFLYFGQIILKGKIPYQYIWDNKPMGIFYIDALGLWLGHGSRWGVWLVEFIFLFISILAAYQAIKRLWGSTTAILSSGIWLWALSRILINGNLVEEYSLTFNFLALFCFIASNETKEKIPLFDALIGAMAFFSFLFRANNIGVELTIVSAVIISTLYHRDLITLLKRLSAIALGVLIPLILVGGYCWFNGFLWDMIQATLLYNFSYTGGHLDLMNGLISGFVYLQIPVWITLIGYFCIFIFFIKSIKNGQLNSLILFLMLAWPVEILFSSLSGRNYEHYYINWLPAMAMNTGFLFYTLFSRINLNHLTVLKRVPRCYAQFALILVLLIALGSSLTIYRAKLATFIRTPTSFEKSDPLIQYIDEHTNPDDRVLAWGGSLRVNLLSKRETMDAYFWYPLYVNSPYTPQMADQFYADLLKNSPQMIVDCYSDAPNDIPRIKKRNENIVLPTPPYNLPLVIDYIEKQYKLETTIGQYEIYRLKP
jgi:hypothetical protein